MPLYDIELNNPSGLLPGALPGSEPFPRFHGGAGRLLDASGKAILMPIRCNTETGFVERLDYSPESNRFEIDPASGRVMVLMEQHSAPLFYIPLTLAQG